MYNCIDEHSLSSKRTNILLHTLGQEKVTITNVISSGLVNEEDFWELQETIPAMGNTPRQTDLQAMPHLKHESIQH